MTAASGIVHEEYHSNKLAKEGGVLEMVQLWVNLPSVSKMTKPKYQPILASEIPRVDLDIGYVRIIAGSYAGTPGPATTHSPMNIFDVSIKAGHRIQLEVQTDHNCLFFSRQGRISYIDGTEKHTLLETEQVGVVDRVNGSWIRIQAMDADASVMVLSGLPLDEPIAARGPFVMNTQKELQQAMFDYQNGKFVVA